MFLNGAQKNTISKLTNLNKERKVSKRLACLLVAATLMVSAASCKKHEKCSDAERYADCDKDNFKHPEKFNCIWNTVSAKCVEKTDEVVDTMTEARCKNTTDAAKCTAIKTENPRYEEECKFDASKPDPEKCYAVKK